MIRKSKPTMATLPKLTKTSMFSRMNYQVERGMNELLSQRSLSKDQWETILNFFNNRRAFCGAEHTGNKRTGIIPDHLVPASQFGEMCIGNIVPACHTCNDTRGDKSWAEYLEKYPSNQRKLFSDQIRKYLKRYPYTPTKVPSDVLSEQEYIEFKRIKDAWAHLWKDALALRGRIGRRFAESNKSLKPTP